MNINTIGFPAGDELDKVIAEALGWRVVNWNDNPSGIKVKQPDTWMLLRPGEVLPSAKFFDTVSTFYTQAEAWAHCLPFSTSADFAISVLGDFAGRWSLSGTPSEPNGDGERYRCELQDGGFVGYASTPALAICRAWLIWKSRGLE